MNSYQVGDHCDFMYTRTEVLMFNREDKMLHRWALQTINSDN